MDFPSFSFLLQESEDANERSRSLAAFEEMLDFLVIRLVSARDREVVSISPHSN